MTTDFRALCKELTDELHGYASANPYHDSDELVARARLALAEPEPPAAGEMAELVACLSDSLQAFCFTQQPSGYPIDHWSRRAVDLLERLERLAPQPVMEGPSDEELTLTYAHAVAAAVDNKQGPFKEEDVKAAQLAGLRTVLARWGQAPDA